MVDITPPPGVRELWLGSDYQKENVDMIVERALNEARSYERKVVWIDRVVIVATVLIILIILPAFLRQSRLHLAGLLGMVLYGCTLPINLWAYWRFYRSVNGAPPPDAPAAAYAEHYIRYQDHRAKFFSDTLRWAAILLSASAMLFAVDWAQGDGSVPLLWVVLDLSAILAGWWMTRYEINTLRSRRAGLRDILDAGGQQAE